MTFLELALMDNLKYIWLIKTIIHWLCKWSRLTVFFEQFDHITIICGVEQFTVGIHGETIDQIGYLSTPTATLSKLSSKQVKRNDTCHFTHCKSYSESHGKDRLSTTAANSSSGELVLYTVCEWTTDLLTCCHTVMTHTISERCKFVYKICIITFKVTGLHQFTPVSKPVDLGLILAKWSQWWHHECDELKVIYCAGKFSLHCMSHRTGDRIMLEGFFMIVRSAAGQNVIYMSYI